MGGLWVDYNLQTTIPGLFAAGEANFSDHGANRLGASALMQGLADGYFVLPYTIGNYLANQPYQKTSTDHEAFVEAEDKVKGILNDLITSKGSKTVDQFHKELGLIMWDYCGMSRTAEGLAKAREEIKKLKQEFKTNLKMIGGVHELNPTLEKAYRVADFIELGALMIEDAYDRNESCGGHFREEYQTPEGEALRDDENYAYVAAWEFQGEDAPHKLHKEELSFNNVKLTQRSYK
jgi:succinate dehydrogenase / fumarate reductase flavoprotein subunit